MHFNTYEDMEKAIANERLFGPPEVVNFIEAMLEVFERELESKTSRASDAGYDTGYDDGWLNGRADLEDTPS